MSKYFLYLRFSLPFLDPPFLIRSISGMYDKGTTRRNVRQRRLYSWPLGSYDKEWPFSLLKKQWSVHSQGYLIFLLYKLRAYHSSICNSVN